MFNRSLNLSDSHSFFLFGARGTGKSTLLSTFFKPEAVLLLDLLNSDLCEQLQTRPSALTEMVTRSNKEWVLIDEVQKVPAILDVVHSLIENKKQKFALTGSSARKLKRSAANLLAGRAFVFSLFPLTCQELTRGYHSDEQEKEGITLDDLLSFGSLPHLFSLQDDRDKRLFLKAYTDTYLKEEILIEQLIRNLPPFRRFLQVSAHQDTELISYSSIARDVLVDPKIISNYYSILEDTLLGFFLEPFHTSVRKRQKKAPKFYWFDLGVRRTLAGTIETRATPKSYEYGSLFESFVVNELYRLLKYSERSFSLSFIRIDNTQEVDLVLERPGLPIVLIEIKSSDHAHPAHLKTLQVLAKDIKGSQAILVSLDKIEKTIDGVSCLYWKNLFREIGLEEKQDP